MSDYMFMLESHLGAEQFRVVGQLRQLAGETGVSIYLTGGAIRDMLGGFSVRDLDFTIEGSAIKLAKAAEKKLGATIVSTDDLRKSAELASSRVRSMLKLLPPPTSVAVEKRIPAASAAAMSNSPLPRYRFEVGQKAAAAPLSAMRTRSCASRWMQWA